jgi:hypothetical protein
MVDVWAFYPTGGPEMIGEHVFSHTAFSTPWEKRTNLLQT